MEGKVYIAVPTEPKIVKPKSQSQIIKAHDSKQLTGVQKVMRAFKEAKGIDANDAAWDKINFARFARSAADVLKIFSDDANAAIVYILAKGQELDDKKMTSWGLEAIARAAATDPRALNPKGEENESEHREVVANRLDGPRGPGGTSSARDIARDTLRAIGENVIRREESVSLDGPGTDQDFDDETFA